MAQMPPLPQQPYRDDALSTSSLMPFMSKNISLRKSRALIPLIATAATCVLLFVNGHSVRTIADAMTYMKILSIFIVFMIFAGIYYYVGERKNMLWYLFPATIVYLQMKYLLGPYIYFFRTVLPGNVEASGFIPAFFGHFVGAGLMEEFMKAVPALIGLAIALRLRKSGQPGSRVERGFALDGPVDGLLYGVAAGGAFILVETLFQYVPGEITRQAQQNSGNQAIGVLFGIMLLLPRVLNGVVGHMAYAGVFGYFIGLAVSHPRSIVKLLALGWVVAAVLHGFWNSSQELLGVWGIYVSAAITLFLFVSCILKAKQLEVSRLGGPIDGHSILAASPYPSAPAHAGGMVPPPAPGVAGMFTAATTAVEKLIGFTARTTVPNPAAVSAGFGPPPPPPATVPASGLSIGTGDVRYALAPNQAIDFTALFGSAGVPGGCSGLIGAAPDGSLEIRNTGSATWTSATPDGATASVPSGTSVTAVAGATLLLGSATIEIAAF